MSIELPDIEEINETPFGEYQEEAIVSLIIDHPDFFTVVLPYFEPSLFAKLECQFIIAHILNYYNEYDVIPTRGMLRDIINKNLTVDDAGWRDIVDIVNRESDPRDVPKLKDVIIEWTKSKAYGKIYDPDTIVKYKNGEYEYIEDILNEANNIQDVGQNGFWFFDQIEKLFDEDESEHISTGFTKLDTYLNDGGPSRGETLVWMAPTGVGKSLTLCNNAISGVLNGLNVLYVTLELSDLKSAIRMLGALSNKPINDNYRINNKNDLMSIVNRIKSTDNIGDLVVYQFPPNEISVNHIHSVIDNLKKSKGWVPDIVVIDYLELMVSRDNRKNADDYAQQKSVATEVRGLAIKEDVLVYTATQTNRSGNDAVNIDVTKMAESYGKSMPMDYLVSLNQTLDEYNAQFNDGEIIRSADARMYIAKNRNGPKFVTIPIQINYLTMKVRES